MTRSRTILVLLSLAIVLARWRSGAEPLDWDLATYAVIGHELNCGQKLYLDAWDIKPPGIFIANALAERVSGYGLGQVYLLGCGCAVGTMLALYAGVRMIDRRGALVAAAVWSIISCDAVLDANRPNTEAFINLFLAVAAALILRSGCGKTSVRSVWIGLAIAAATLFKQVALAPGFLLLAADVAWPPATVRRRAALLQGVIALGVVGLVWAGCFGYFALTGRGRIFYVTAIAYPREYGGSVLENLRLFFQPEHLSPTALTNLMPALLLGAAAFFKPSRALGITAALLIGSTIAIILPGRFFTHYFQLWLLPAALAAGLGAAALFGLPLNRGGKLAYAACALTIVGLVALTFPQLRQTPRQLAEASYGPMHAWLQPVGEEIARRLQPGEAFFQWADEPWLYFVSKQRPPGPALWRAHALKGPLADQISQRTLAGLQAHPPALVIVWEANDPGHDDPISRWISGRYAPVNDGINRSPLLLLAPRR